jgi:hypothetical protein
MAGDKAVAFVRFSRAAEQGPAQRVARVEGCQGCTQTDWNDRYFFLPFFAAAFLTGFGAAFFAGAFCAGLDCFDCAGFGAGLAEFLGACAFAGPGPGAAAVAGGAFTGAGAAFGAAGAAAGIAFFGFLPRLRGAPSAAAACACAGAAAAAAASFLARPLLGGGGGGGGSGGEYGVRNRTISLCVRSLPSMRSRNASSMIFL